MKLQSPQEMSALLGRGSGQRPVRDGHLEDCRNGRRWCRRRRCRRRRRRTAKAERKVRPSLVVTPTIAPRPLPPAITRSAFTSRTMVKMFVGGRLLAPSALSTATTSNACRPPATGASGVIIQRAVAAVRVRLSVVRPARARPGWGTTSSDEQRTAETATPRRNLNTSRPSHPSKGDADRGSAPVRRNKRQGDRDNGVIASRNVRDGHSCYLAAFRGGGTNAIESWIRDCARCFCRLSVVSAGRPQRTRRRTLPEQTQRPRHRRLPRSRRRDSPPRPFRRRHLRGMAGGFHAPSHDRDQLVPGHGPTTWRRSPAGGHGRLAHHGAGR